MSFLSEKNAARRWKEVLAGGLLLLCLLSVAAGMRNACRFSQDFQYDAARALMLGIDPYEVSRTPPYRTESGTDGKLDSFYAYFESIDAPQKMEANQFPSLLMELFPMVLLPFRLAVFVWMVLNLLFSAGILFFLRKTFFQGLSGEEFFFLALLMIAGTPWRNQLGVGQHTLFSFCFFLAAVMCSEKGKSVPAGVLLAVSMFKYTLTLPLAIYFVYRRRWKEPAVCAGIHLAFTGLAAWLLHRDFWYLLTAPLKVSMALSAEGSLDIGAFLGGGIRSVAVTGALMVFLVVTALMMPAGEKARCVLFSVLVLTSLIMTYHRTYDYFVYIAAYPGVSVLAGQKAEKSRQVLGRFSLAVPYFVLLFILFFGLRLFSEGAAVMVFAAVFYYGFLICLVLFALLRRKMIAGAENG